MTRAVERIVRAALAEDLGGRAIPSSDITTASTLGRDATGTAKIVMREAGVVAGLEAASLVFRIAAAGSLTVRTNLVDGKRVRPGTVLMTVTGPLAPLLAAERTALNLLQRMSGIATLTSKFVRAVSGSGAKITDTRKTAPGLRVLDKLAVAAGGGVNHRMGLYDMVLIKDNHIAAAGSLREAVTACVRNFEAGRGRRRTRAAGSPRGGARPNVNPKIEVETRTLSDVREALRHDAVGRIMFDNFPRGRLAAAVRLVGGRKETEASGGITLANVAAVARTGVDFISVGALTHSVAAPDIALDLQVSRPARRRSRRPARSAPPRTTRRSR
jgi:nicotinate-nucleotide pyrophosphorylase (carboxylating)